MYYCNVTCYVNEATYKYIYTHQDFIDYVGARYPDADREKWINWYFRHKFFWAISEWHQLFVKIDNSVPERAFCVREVDANGNSFNKVIFALYSDEEKWEYKINEKME